MDQLLEQAIAAGLQKEAEALMEKKVAEFRTELSQKIAGLVLDVQKHVSYQTMGQDIVITVRKMN